MQQAQENRRCRARDVGARRLPPLRARDRLGGRPGRRRGLRDHRGPARARRGRGHGQRRDPRGGGGGAGGRRRSHARELRRGAARGSRAGSSSSGSKRMPRRFRSTTSLSTSSRRRSARSSPPITRPWPTRCSASAGRAGRSGWPTSCRRARARRSSRRWVPSSTAPPGAQPPLLWGERITSRAVRRSRRLLEAHPPNLRRAEPFTRGVRRAVPTTFGPIVALREHLASDQERAAQLDRELDEFATRFNRGAPAGPAEYPYDYLLVVARKR